jgi:hypothetical protein
VYHTFVDADFVSIEPNKREERMNVGDMNDVFTIRQTARVLGITRRTIYNRMESGTLDLVESRPTERSLCYTIESVLAELKRQYEKKGATIFEQQTKRNR